MEPLITSLTHIIHHTHMHTLHLPSTSLPLSYFLPGSLPAAACSWSHQHKEGRLPWPEELQPKQLPGGCPWGLVRRPGPECGQRLLPLCRLVHSLPPRLVLMRPGGHTRGQLLRHAAWSVQAEPLQHFHHY